MIIIPAIDLKNAKCVRLSQGKADQQTVYSDNPAQIAQQFYTAGAKRIHVVDLDGAFEGSPKNIKQLEQIRSAFSGVLEFGGGVRTMDNIKTLISIGVDKIIIGTMAIQSEQFVRNCIDTYGDIFIAGIDANNGFVAVKGWVETTSIEAVILAKKMKEIGISEIIFTDIARDGMLTGPNISSLTKILNGFSGSVIASGGISSPADLEKLVPLVKEGLTGAIIGKALYTGAINLNEVIKCWQNE
ncbi:MAG: 1-(5-phosphoribosyl)-5-[(5-phosphoribosylamino)methylideneamino]imidazole-4-carboxamide isomerase [Candidatus Auribacterota bacterium]|jgi:phosphoribosylformimino-5-aminoimidazole carboxamide ribotide isomerase|nr:1-(5-phosphoribosyl)-5-[(5-phosphoribosylamino)methylideneamino]imidazole-4-carboxamide isomerase [Candidatus Auribacterota bacterium]